MDTWLGVVVLVASFGVLGYVGYRFYRGAVTVLRDPDSAELFDGEDSP